MPYGIFPGHRSHNALRQLEDELHFHTRICDSMNRDELVKPIMGRLIAFLLFCFRLSNTKNGEERLEEWISSNNISSIKQIIALSSHRDIHILTMRLY